MWTSYNYRSYLQKIPSTNKNVASKSCMITENNYWCKNVLISLALTLAVCLLNLLYIYLYTKDT